LVKVPVSASYSIGPASWSVNLSLKAPSDCTMRLQSASKTWCYAMPKNGVEMQVTQALLMTSQWISFGLISAFLMEWKCLADFW